MEAHKVKSVQMHQCCHSNLNRNQENWSAPLTHSLLSSFSESFLLNSFSCPRTGIGNSFSAVRCCFALFTFPIALIRMAFTLHQCPGKVGKVSNCFLPAKDANSHALCPNCRCKSSIADHCCECCCDWTIERWEKVFLFPVSIQLVSCLFHCQA